MIELEADMWKERADAYVITTNGDVNQNGEAVMGRGCALEAKRKFTGLATHLGELLRDPEMSGNRVYDLGFWNGYKLVSFPVKHHWQQQADLNLIKQSAEDLLCFTDLEEWARVLVPRPGCGNGSLRWSDVKPILEPLLDDRFVIIHKRGSR